MSGHPLVGPERRFAHLVVPENMVGRQNDKGCEPENDLGPVDANHDAPPLARNFTFLSKPEYHILSSLSPAGGGEKTRPFFYPTGGNSVGACPAHL
jgi:hypothetical protein